jgi:hypothetical protein
MAESREESSFLLTLKKTLLSVIRASPFITSSDPNYLSKFPLFNAITLGGMVSTYEF